MTQVNNPLKKGEKEKILKQIEEKEAEVHFLNTQIANRNVEIKLLNTLISQLKAMILK